MSLHWRRRGSIDAGRYVLVQDGSQIFCAEVPASMTLAQACEEFVATSIYEGREGEIVPCEVKLIAGGKTVETRQIDVPCRKRS